MTKMAGSGSISHRHGSADPDPYQMADPQHCLQGKETSQTSLKIFNIQKVIQLPHFLCVNSDFCRNKCYIIHHGLSSALKVSSFFVKPSTFFIS
jgi:hypothetical protein